MLSQKTWIAVLAIAIALTGVVSGLKWLTLLALAVWIAAMMVFGTGRRSRDSEPRNDGAESRISE